MGEPRRCWLRWHNYSDSVTSALESLRYDEDFLDVTIACDGHSIRAHKLVLSACSAYFKKILKDHPCDHPIIILDGLEWQVIVSLLHFMYCGEVVVEEELLPNLLNAATNLSVTGLTQVTSAIFSAQATKDDDSNDDYYSEDEEYEEEDPECDEDCEKETQRNDKSLAEIQKTHGERDETESDSESSLSEQEAPPSKRPRTVSCDAHVSDEIERQRDSLDSTKNFSSSATPKESKTSCHNVTNGLSPMALPLHAATPLVHHPSTNSKSISKKIKESSKTTVENDGKNGERKTKLILNGDSNIKEENVIIKEEGDDSNPPENGDSDTLKLATSTNSGGLLLPNGLLESCGVPVGMTAAMGPVNYATLLAAGNILPASASTNPASAVLISSPDNVVQQVLLPTVPSSATVALTTVPTLTSGTTPATATCAPPTTTSSLATSTSGQPYIHPSLVSLQEVQATLEQYQRKLAFHEPRPCPTCRRMYRDAATLRTHMAIMHAEGKEPFSCTCGALFRTKYDMYQHKKNGHR